MGRDSSRCAHTVGIMWETCQKLIRMNSIYFIYQIIMFELILLVLLFAHIIEEIVRVLFKSID
jgi:hypothetical protein